MAIQLSKNKLKFIRRHAAKLDPPQIAARLNIPLKAVLAQLEKDGAGSGAGNDRDVYGACYPVFLLVLFLSPLVFSNLFYEFENVPRSLLIQIGAFLIPIMWLLGQARGSDRIIAGGPAFKPLLLLAVWALISISWSTYRYGAFSQWVHWAACAMFYGIAYHLHPGGKGVRTTLHVIMAAAGLIAVLGNLQYLGGLDWVPQQVAPAATFNNKNMAAQFMVMTLPISFVWAVTSPDRRLTWFYALMTAIGALFLFYTRSRAAWLAMLAEVVLIGSGLWLYRKKAGRKPLFDKNRILALGVSLFILLAFMQLGPHSFLPKVPGFKKGAAARTDARKMGENLDLSSGRHRLVLWKNTLAIIARHPVAGVGIRNVQVHYPTTPDKRYHRLNLHTQRVHNDYLQMVAELGLPVLLVLLWIAVLMIRAAVAIIRSPDSAGWIPSALICLAAISGLAVNAVFSFPFNRALPPFLLAVYLGLFFKIATLAEVPAGRATDGAGLVRGRALVLAGICAAVFVAWGFTAYHWARADYYYRKHVLAFLAGDDDRAVSYGQKALEHSPGRGAIMRSLSRVYVRKNDYENAATLFTRIDNLFPHAALNLYHQAVASINQGHYDAAEQAIRKGLDVIPQSGKLHGLLGVVSQARHQSEAAVDAYRQAIDFSPQVASHYEWLGQLLYEMKRYNEADPVLAKWVEIEPEKVDGHVKLGLIYLNRAEPESAEGRFRKALDLSPDSAILHRYLGVALIHQGKLDEAVLAFQTAVARSQGRDAVAHNNLGSALARQNRLDAAADHFRAALKAAPDYLEARRNLEKVELLLKHSE